MQNYKADYLKELERKVHEQRIAGSLHHQDYRSRMEEIKKLKLDKELDWRTLAREELPPRSSSVLVQSHAKDKKLPPNIPFSSSFREKRLKIAAPKLSQTPVQKLFDSTTLPQEISDRKLPLSLR